MTPEQKQRLAEAVIHRDESLGATKSGVSRAALLNMIKTLRNDIDFLLSLVKSQEAGDELVGPCVGCGHNNYDAERSECAQRWMEGQYSVVCGCPCAKHNSITNAATSMRSACVTVAKDFQRMDRDDFYRKYKTSMLITALV